MRQPQTQPVIDPIRRLRRARGRRWRSWLIVWALLCTITLYSIEVTHDHKTIQAQLRCPVCHVFGHSPLEVYTPDLAPVLNHTLLSVLALPIPAAVVLLRAFQPKPQPRAPPAISTPIV